MFAHVSTEDLGLTCPEDEPINTDATTTAVGTGVTGTGTEVVGTEVSGISGEAPETETVATPLFLSKSASQKMQSKTKTRLQFSLWQKLANSVKKTKEKKEEAACKSPLVFGLCLDDVKKADSALSHEDSTAPPLTGTGTGTETGTETVVPPVTGGEHEPVCGTWTCGKKENEECPPCPPEEGTHDSGSAGTHDATHHDGQG